jgi:hypothetical protein
MAHRSKKKHLKHLRQQEAATPPAKSPAAKAESAAARIAKSGGTQRRAPELKDAKGTKAKAKASKKGIVRRLAGKATEAVTARPRKAIASVKAGVKSRVRRVKSLLGAAA